MNKTVPITIIALLIIIGGYFLLFTDDNIFFTSQKTDSSTTKINCDGEVCKETETIVTKLERVKTLQLTDKSQGYGARPEIASNGEYIYIVYMGDITTKRSHKVRVYDLDFNLISEKILQAGTVKYGGVTDIRITKDDNYVYSFYEMASPKIGASLFGAKYKMDKNFTKVAESDGPIAQAPFFFDAVDGEETLNDPASLVVDGRVYLMTQITDKGRGALNAKTLYNLRELSSDLSEVIETREIDLSDVMDGWAGLASLVYINGKIQTVQGSLVSYPSGINSDFRTVRFDENWGFDKNNDVFNLTETKEVTETMPVGVRFVDNTLFISYRRGKVTPVSRENPKGSGEIWLNMYNDDFKLIDSIQVSAEGIEGEHASVEVIGDYVYVAYGGTDSDSDVMRENVYVDIFKFRLYD